MITEQSTAETKINQVFFSVHADELPVGVPYKILVSLLIFFLFNIIVKVDLHPATDNEFP
jgi:hypothetical protein